VAPPDYLLAAGGEDGPPVPSTNFFDEIPEKSEYDWMAAANIQVAHFRIKHLDSFTDCFQLLEAALVLAFLN